MAIRPFRFLSQLLDVDISSPVDNDRLQYEAASGKWKNTSVSGVAPHHASHESGGSDEVSVTVDMVDAEASTSGQVPTSDGAGGVAWQDQSGGGAPTDAKYIVQQPDGTLSAEQALSSLATGIVKNTTTTGVLSIAAEGSDYYGPGGTDVAVADGGTGASDAGTARTNLGLVIGTDVEAHDPDLTTIAGLAPSNDDVLQRKAGAWVNRTLAQLISDLGGLGTTFQPKDTTLDTYAGIDPSANVQSILSAADYAAIRSLLGLVIGTNVQAQDAELSAIAGLTSAADKLPYFTGSGTAALATLTSFIRTLLDDTDAATARATLGVIASLFEEGGAQQLAVTVGQMDAEASMSGQVPVSDGAGGVAWGDQSGSGGAPTDATYITQTANGTLSAEQALSSLATGVVKVTNGTGVLSTAAEGTDYYGPGGTDVAVTDGGTGASDASGARTNLGLGALATGADASDVPITDTGGYFAGTDAEAALQEIGADLAATKYVTLLVTDPNGDALTTGDEKLPYWIPAKLNGLNLVSVKAFVSTVSSSGVITIQIRNVTDSVDMLSTALTIDASEVSSSTAATPAVIDTGHDDVATEDHLAVDVDGAGTGVKGLVVELGFA